MQNDTVRNHSGSKTSVHGALAIPHLKKKTIKRIVLGSFVLLIVMVALFPIIWIFLTSLKTPEEVFRFPPRLFFPPTLANYAEVLFGRNTDFFGSFVNSVIITVTSTILSVAIGALAAYSLARLPLPAGGQFSQFVLWTRMLPSIGLVIPIYLLLNKARLFDTRPGLILVYTAFNIPIVIWILRGFFEELPSELEDCALIDGATRMGAFLRVTLPLSAPALAATAVFSAFWIWNDFIFSFIFSSQNAVTLIVMTSRFMEEEGVRWGSLAAAAVIAIVPVFVFSLFIQRFLTRGLLTGAVKG
jgi:multiple sugar transport system permease protein